MSDTDDLTLEKLKIHEKLVKLESIVEKLVAIREIEHTDLLRMHTDNKDILEKLYITIHGNGQIGAMVRIDRLEQAARIFAWAMGTMVVAIVTKFVADLLIGR